MRTLQPPCPRSVLDHGPRLLMGGGGLSSFRISLSIRCTSKIHAREFTNNRTAPESKFDRVSRVGLSLSCPLSACLPACPSASLLPPLHPPPHTHTHARAFASMRMWTSQPARTAVVLHDGGDGHDAGAVDVQVQIDALRTHINLDKVKSCSPRT